MDKIIEIFRQINASPRMCLMLAATGGMLCVMMDILGITSISDKLVLNSTVEFPFPVYIVLPFVSVVSAIIVGISCRKNGTAPIYGASIGQFQFFLPLIYHYIIDHSGSDFSIWWRALCGIPLTAAFSGIAFSIKILIKDNEDINN